jgi:hypothetical protein
MVSRNDLEGLCTFNIEYHSNDSTRELAYARQTLAFYSKDADVKLCDTKEAMFRSFINTEMQCKATNKRMSSLFHLGTLEFHCDSIVFKLRRKIDEILGDTPEIVDLPLSFGPGVNVGITKEETSPRWKLRAIPTCTESVLNVIEDLVRTAPHWFSLLKGETRTVIGRLGSVAKNALTDRSIIVEAIINGTAQKGIGSIIKERLLRFGCNLYTQTRNHQLALQGSVDDDVVTLDIRNASNTVALLVVFHLVSEKWFNLLDCFRTPVIDVGGNSQLTLEMFSSMGNGFTFELESLIFYSLALVVADECRVSTSNISVYGDDIIIPREMLDRYMKCLTFLGFETNLKKSFTEGPFRESCGHDYFLGVDIRPFYKKARWTHARVVGLLNHDANHLYLFEDMRRDLELIVSGEYPYGPKGYGDGCIQLDSFDPSYKDCFERCTRTNKQRIVHGQRDGFIFKLVSKVPLKDFERYRHLTNYDYVLPLYLIAQKPYVPELRTLRYATEEKTHYNWLMDDNGMIYEVAVHTQLHALNDRVRSSLLTYDILQDEIGREADPYVMKGGFTTKVDKVYVLPGHI